MNAEIYNFQLGSFECMAVSDGTFTYKPPLFPKPAPFLFSNASAVSIEQVFIQKRMSTKEYSEWVTPYTCLFVNTGKHHILIDTGAANFGPDTGRLFQNLLAAGIAPTDIDLVILTHAHVDHIGGITDISGKLNLPSAKYIIHKDEWNFWISGEAEKQLTGHVRDVLVSSARKNLPPILNRVQLIEGEAEIVPGISIISVRGHTPGLIAVMISSQGQKLVCLSDAILHPIHIEYPEWCALVDMAHSQLTASRLRLLDIATSANTLVHCFHFPFPGLGRVIKESGKFYWRASMTQYAWGKI